MKRRNVFTGLVTLGAASFASSQPRDKVWRIGVLLHSLRWNGGLAESLKVPLSALGYDEGRNLKFELRDSLGQQNRLNSLAAELVAAKVDLIVAPLNLEVQAAKRATRTIPIVMMFGSAPVELGLVASLARPGGNLTGTTTTTPESSGKFIELMRQAVPNLNRLTVLNEPGYPGIALYQQQFNRAAASLGIKMRVLPVTSSTDIDAAFKEVERNRPDALMLAMTGPIAANARRIVEFSAQQRMPAMYSIAWPVRMGGLMAYQPKFGAMAKRNAAMIDSILKGTRAGDIPIEEPAEFELVINLRTARDLGLTIPQTLLLRADELIQ